jgi:antirestriction protein ArdC
MRAHPTRHFNEGESAMTATRTDVYARVTDSIVAELEKGVRPWLKPWNW